MATDLLSDAFDLLSTEAKGLLFAVGMEFVFEQIESLREEKETEFDFDVGIERARATLITTELIRKLNRCLNC